MVMLAHNHRLERWKQEVQKFKVVLSYIVSLRANTGYIKPFYQKKNLTVFY